MANLKELSKREPLFTGGHRACAGCAGAIAIRQVMIAASAYKVVVGSATGCMEVVSTLFPYTSWKVPFIHSAFENSAASVSGVETAYRSLKKQGKIKDDIKFIAFGGDGGTYDIGLQSLSGAMERGHDMLYVCYNNEAYMNTGIQRSGATPFGAATTTAPSGSVKQGKEQHRKDMTKIMVAHNIPYVGQTVVGKWNDLISKVEKALSIPGPKFINILAPCRLGWAYKPEDTVDLGVMALDTCVWPMYEVVDGVYKLNYKPKEKKPVVEYLKTQARFSHIMKPENKSIVDAIQQSIDKEWAVLLKLCGEEA